MGQEFPGEGTQRGAASQCGCIVRPAPGVRAWRTGSALLVHWHAAVPGRPENVRFGLTRRGHRLAARTIEGCPGSGDPGPVRRAATAPPCCRSCCSAPATRPAWLNPTGEPDRTPVLGSSGLARGGRAASRANGARRRTRWRGPRRRSRSARRRRTLGCRKAICLPPAPVRGFSSSRRRPAARQRSSTGPMSSAATAMWCRPGPFLAMKRGDGALVGHGGQQFDVAQGALPVQLQEGHPHVLLGHLLDALQLQSQQVAVQGDALVEVAPPRCRCGRRSRRCPRAAGRRCG